jgi:Flp pilus assembly protein TadD
LQQAWKLHRAGRAAEAERSYRDVLRQAPGHSDANNLLGLLCLQSKRPREAEKFIRRALRTDPTNPQSHYNLGLACVEQKRFDDAAQHFGRAAQLQPGNIDSVSAQANALRLAGQPREAVDILLPAVRRQPDDRGARHNLGLALNDQGAALNRSGDSVGAIAAFRQALEFTPRHPQALMNLGLSLEQSGQLDEAARCYQASIAARPDFADPHFHLAHLRSHRSSREEIDAMLTLFNDESAGEEDRVRLAFGLGFALESTGEHAQAFHYMSEAHRLQGRRSTFSVDEERKRFAAIQQLFTAERIEQLGLPGAFDSRPLLISGMPRSGTTLAEQILASHPEVHGAGERTLLAQAANALAGSDGPPFPFGLENPARAELQAQANRYLRLLAEGAGEARRITDTTPMNFLLIGLAAMMLPGARFIICLRDPMDNGLSLYRQYLTGVNHFTHDLEDLGGYLNLHHDLIDHWLEQLPGRVHLIRYERLVNDPESQTRQLLDFCGLPFDARCLAFHESGRTVRSPSAAQVSQPVYNSSVGAWRHYEKELAPLQRVLCERKT